MTPNYNAALRYQAAWLDVPPERLQCESFINPTPERERRVQGFPKPVRAYALRMEGQQEIYAACVPELASRLSFTRKKPTSRFFWFDLLNPGIDASRARLLQKTDWSAFLQFYGEAYPKLRDFGWLPDYFDKIVTERRCFGVFEDQRLVCVADAPTIPYLSELIVEPGIITLPRCRRKGYAAAACAAFIKEQLQHELIPVWTCALDNAASASLAQHLGFRSFGVLWRID